MNSVIVEASTEVPSVIGFDTTWTPANGSYELRGSVLVKDGVTLRIDPGTTVNLNEYYILVNGTLDAKGTDTNPIFLNNGIIRFTESSVNWDENLDYGCRIENSNLSTSQIDINNSPKIHNNFLNTINIDGSPKISENTITGEVNISGSPTIIENSIINSIPGSVRINGGSPVIVNNTINCRIIVSQGSPTISKNTINDGVHVDARDGTVKIINNIINIRGDYNIVHVQGVSATVSSNKITGIGKRMGVNTFGSRDFFISNNTISNCLTGIRERISGSSIIIERNEIKNNDNGIDIEYQPPFYYTDQNDSYLIIRNNFITDNLKTGVILGHPSGTIINNTIANNQIGITIFYTATILNNNIYSNEYNLKSQIAEDIEATSNWWGTSNITDITQTMYDFKYDFNLGIINFVPILNQENPEISEFPSWIILTIFVITTLSIIIYRKNMNNIKYQESRTCTKTRISNYTSSSILYTINVQTVLSTLF